MKTIKIASSSFGKDSIATILTALEHGEPLHEVVYAEVMFSPTLSAEHPVHAAWINEVAIPWVENLGLKFTRLRAKKTYIDLFTHKITRSAVPERNGKICGFPHPSRCFIGSRLKQQPLKQYLKGKEAFYYVGICADEPKRLARLEGQPKISLLSKYQITQEMAKNICRDAGLLSPVYEHTNRTGCWFGPNERLLALRRFKEDYPHIWGELEKLHNKHKADMVTPFFAYSTTLDQI